MRRPAAAGAAVVFSLLAAAGVPLLFSGAAWWEIRFELTVEGDYSVHGPGGAFSGEFEYRASWRGALEQDGADFILFHGRAEVPSWRVRETPEPADAGQAMTEADAPGRPRLKVNYVIRQDNEVRFTFAIEGIDVPLHEFQGKFPLSLPRSKGPSTAEGEYARFITKGDNLISVDDGGLANKRLEKSFSWEWARRGWTTRQEGAVPVTGSHKADVAVTFIRHD